VREIPTNRNDKIKKKHKFISAIYECSHVAAQGFSPGMRKGSLLLRERAVNCSCCVAAANAVWVFVDVLTNFTNLRVWRLA
jgi:hypothetical protein